MSFWGTPDTSVRFCEKKYTHYSWIAEYHNTISSIYYILAALPFIKTKISKVAWSCIGVGIGSMMLHGTVRFYGQWVDELSMLFFSYNSLRHIDKRFPPLSPFLIAIYLKHWKFFPAFISVFLSMQLRILYLLSKRKKNKLLLKLYVFFFTLGFSCWITDKFVGERYEKYKLHAYWHFFTALSMLSSMKLLLTY